MFLGLAASLSMMIGFVWLILTLATHALPVFMALTIGMLAHGTGAGLLGATLVGLGAGALTAAVGPMLLQAVSSPALRTLIGTIYTAPAAFCGYHAIHGLAELSGPAELWSQASALVGARSSPRLPRGACSARMGPTELRWSRSLPRGCAAGSPKACTTVLHGLRIVDRRSRFAYRGGVASVHRPDAGRGDHLPLACSMPVTTC